MSKKELEKMYTVCIAFYSVSLIWNMWYYIIFAPDVKKEVFYGIVLCMNFLYLFVKLYKKREIPIAYYIISLTLSFLYTCSCSTTFVKLIGGIV